MSLVLHRNESGNGFREAQVKTISGLCLEAEALRISRVLAR